MALAPNEWARRFIIGVDERGMASPRQCYECRLHTHGQIRQIHGKETWFSTEPDSETRETLTAATKFFQDEGEFHVWTGAGNDTDEKPAAIFLFPERLANALRKRFEQRGVQFDARRRWRMIPQRSRRMRADGADASTRN